MMFMCVFWLIATSGILVGFLLVSLKSVVPNIVPNLYLFGKNRELGDYGLSQKRVSFLQVPKSWFVHFYLAGIVCNSFVIWWAIDAFHYTGRWPTPLRHILVMVGYDKSQALMSPVSVLFAVFMIQIQVIRRFLECVFVSSYSKSTMSIVIYIVGVMFYSLLGISVLSQAQERLIDEDFDHETVHGYHLAAQIIFFWASYKQNKVNRIFAKLRKDKSGKVENTRHHIPHGDLFELCSCPHYLMEIIIYASINLVFLGQHQTLMCILLFVVSNQSISAYLSHRWYKETFPTYPVDRKVLIPYIW